MSRIHKLIARMGWFCANPRKKKPPGNAPGGLLASQLSLPNEPPQNLLGPQKRDSKHRQERSEQALGARCRTAAGIGKRSSAGPCPSSAAAAGRVRGAGLNASRPPRAAGPLDIRDSGLDAHGPLAP